MAEKSKAQGRSRPQAQSKGPNRQAQQKRNPDGGRSAANGAARRPGGVSQREKGDDGPQPGGAGKVGDKIKQHPITAAALGAGLTLLAAQGLRMAVGAAGARSGEDEEQDDSPDARSSREDEDDSEEPDEAEEQDDDAGEEEGGGFGARLRRGASSLGSKIGSAFQGSGGAIRRGARSGYERGRQNAEQGWQNHPLFMCGVALAAGAAAGFLLPTTRQEDRLMGGTSDKLAGRFKKGATEAFRQGRSIAGKALNEAVSSTAKEAEREGLTPDRLGKKFKRVFSNVRDAVAEAVQED